MYANVVVLTYQPPEIQTYTYEIPKELESKVKVGQLVSIPFGKRNPLGIVLSTDYRLPTTNYQIKPVTSTIFPFPLLLPYQIELLKWMAFYYHAPMVNCLEAMLPEIPSVKQLRSDLAKDSARSDFVKTTLVLVPSINQLPQTLAIYPQSKNFVVYHNQLNVGQRFSAWLKILSGNVDYIFGSRSAVFAPCPNLKEIIIFDEHDQGYRDERSPYYNTLTIAEKISELTKTQLKIVDSAPKVTTYFNHQKEILLSSRSRAKRERNDLKTKIASSITPRNDKVVKTQIVSMQNERHAGNRSPLSQILEDYIKLGYVKNKKILLFLNKKSESGHVYCRNCKYSEFAAIAPKVCPNCQSADIWFGTTNVNSLANLVKKLVPNATVNIISTQLPNYSTTQLPTIDIATAAVFYKLMPQIYDLVVHVQTDSAINIADFTSAEKLFAQITNLKRIARGLLLLQTYNPDNATITSAATDDYQKFYEDQIAQRKALSYPPFAILVKLRLLGKKEENVEQKSQKLYDLLTTQLLNYSTTQLPIILGPYKPIFTGKTSKYNIILKIPIIGYSLKDREKAIMTASPQLLKIPKSWQVEVEPESII